MEPFIQEEHLFHLKAWEEAFPGLVAGFTTRQGGSSQSPYDTLNLGLHVGDQPAHVLSNREQLARQLQFPFAGWTCAEQVHGTLVMPVTADKRGAGREQLEDALPAADGLYTAEQDTLLTSFYADCVPLFFLDPANRVIGLAHAGWKGTVGRISEKMVKALQQQYSSKPEELLVAIGPSIGGCCYEVDDRVIQHVRDASRNWQESVEPMPNDKYLLDLKTLNEHILLESGVLSKHISKSGWCTSCRTDLFFSHRREGGKTGRMASFIGWRAEGDR